MAFFLARHNSRIPPLCMVAGSVGAVSREDREKAKRVCYGIIYGLTAYGLAQQQGTNLSTSSAQVGPGDQRRRGRAWRGCVYV